jgi:hypothetical protein
MYPENWNITEDTDDGQVLGFTLESPTSAFMTVTEYPWTVTPADAMEQAFEILRTEYDEVEYETLPTDLTWEGEALPDCMSGDARFYYLDLMVISRLLAFSLQHRTFLVQIQAEDRDFDRLELVFKAILVSMLQSVKNE